MFRFNKIYRSWYRTYVGLGYAKEDATWLALARMEETA